MPEPVPCPTCRQPLIVTPAVYGKMVRCPKCTTVFTVPEPLVAAVPAPLPPPPPPPVVLPVAPPLAMPIASEPSSAADESLLDFGAPDARGVMRTGSGYGIHHHWLGAFKLIFGGSIALSAASALLIVSILLFSGNLLVWYLTLTVASVIASIVVIVGQCRLGTLQAGGGTQELLWFSVGSLALNAFVLALKPLLILVGPFGRSVFVSFTEKVFVVEIPTAWMIMEFLVSAIAWLIWLTFLWRFALVKGNRQLAVLWLIQLAVSGGLVVLSLVLAVSGQLVSAYPSKPALIGVLLGMLLVTAIYLFALVQTRELVKPARA